MNRRRLLLSAVPIVGFGLLGLRLAQAQIPRLRESDPAAQAAGYKDKASTVDARKWATYKAGDTCANCQLYMGDPKDATAPCDALGGKIVAAAGWCALWVNRA